MGNTNIKNLNAILVLHNRALGKINVLKLHDSANHPCKDLKILKFCDLVDSHNCLFMAQL